MSGFETLRLLPGAILEPRGAGWVLITPSGELALPQVSDGAREAIARLIATWIDADSLLDIVEAGDGLEAIPHFSLLLDRLAAAGALQSAWGTSEQHWVEFTPALLDDGMAWQDLGGDWVLRLSPLALLRCEGEGAVCETAASGRRAALLTRSATSVAASLLLGADVATACASVAASDREVAGGLLRRMLAAGMARHVAGGSGAASSGSDVVEWEFHDALFHARSRLGRHVGGYGGTFRRGAGRPALPVLKERMSDEVTVLAREDLERARVTDPPFAQVMEARRSSSEFGSALKVEELGRFLHRAARVVSVRDTAAGPTTIRPYPAAGGLYELELYPLVSACHGLHPGLYQYRPHAHELCRLCELTPTLVWMLEFARASLRSSARPPILVIMAARFERMFAKYDSIAYSLILKDVGVLLQSMSLVATAMGLASCPIGGGSFDAFASAAGLDVRMEAAVGEFALGSRASSTAESDDVVPALAARPAEDGRHAR